MHCGTLDDHDNARVALLNGNKPKMAYSRDPSKMAIMDNHGLSRTVKVYQVLTRKIKECEGLSRTVMDCHELSQTVMNCHGLTDRLTLVLVKSLSRLHILKVNILLGCFTLLGHRLINLIRIRITWCCCGRIYIPYL